MRWEILFDVLFFLLMSVNMAMGQTQQCYVKTLGRPNASGVALSDVIIKIKGLHNPVKSDGNGVFAI